MASNKNVKLRLSGDRDVEYESAYVAVLDGGVLQVKQGGVITLYAAAEWVHVEYDSPGSSGGRSPRSAIVV